MTKHEHKVCEHEIKHCAQCDECYCTKCETAWIVKVSTLDIVDHDGSSEPVTMHYSTDARGIVM